MKSKWFQHLHRWRSVRVNKIGLPDPKDERCQGEIILQECCGCDAIRTITVEPGIAPVVRMAKAQ